MNQTPLPRGRRMLAVVVVVSGLSVAAGLIGCSAAKKPPDPTIEVVADIPARVHEFCGACHRYPPPDSFPRSAWKEEVERGYGFFQEASMDLRPPPMDAVIKYYEERAPEELPLLTFPRPSKPLDVDFERLAVAALPHKDPPSVSNVNLVRLFDKRRLDILTCDMRRGQVMVYSPYEASPAWRVLANVSHPAHAEVVDLDGDGILDILVANLGSFMPTDQRSGSVVWLRGHSDGTFTPYTLLDSVGRVADVQAADFRGIGKLDLIVAAFGWNHTGEIYYLENQTTDWSKPKFEPRVLDKRHGTIHVPVADLNGDGHLDFIALISQEHETIVAFLGDGKGNFTPKELYRGPHPAYGSSGIQLVDLNDDGKLDILYTNGDTLDQPPVLKPYHGVQWLENKGNLKFEHHPITPMYGVHRAVAADFRGVGRKDIVAVSFLPVETFPQRKQLNLDSVIYLEQTEPGKFGRHSLETVTCNHATCVAGDIFARGKIDLVTGNMTASTERELGITIWKNLGPKGKTP